MQNIKSSSTSCVSRNWVLGGAVGLGTALKGERSRVRFRTVDMRQPQSLTEMSTSDISWG